MICLNIMRSALLSISLGVFNKNSLLKYYFNDCLYVNYLHPLCDFCNESLDSTEHGYFYCTVTQEFLRKITYLGT